MTSTHYIQKFATRESQFNAALDAVHDDGWLMEFGVGEGRSVNEIAAHFPGRTVYGFDSFEGLPASWTHRYQKGHFAQDKVPSLKDNVSLRIGDFRDTLPVFLQAACGPGPAFIHIDCDLYDSAWYVLSKLASCGHIRPGTIIQFDEYVWKEGDRLYCDEHDAWHEASNLYGLEYKWIGYNRCHYGLEIARSER